MTSKFLPLFAVLLATLALACKPSAPQQIQTTQERAYSIETEAPTAAAGAAPPNLRKTAESRLFPALKPELAEFIRAQEWFTDVTEAEYVMLETLRDMDRAAQRHGVAATFMDSLRLTAEQGWLHDGFDDNEAKAMTALYRAYQASLADRYVPQLDAEMLASSIRGNYFHVVSLPESGEVTVVLASDSEPLARPALGLAVENLPKVEAIVGKFPYPFVYIYVTDLGGDGLLGINRNEFVWIGLDGVETNTVAHELTHATLYGNFPLWFEEGVAYYVGSYANNELKSQQQDSLRVIAATGRPRKLDLGAKFDHSDRGYFASISQGFLFFQGVVDIQSLDGLSQVIRSLRSKTYNNDNELLRAIVSNSPPDKQQAMQQYLCGAVIGLRSGCKH